MKNANDSCCRNIGKKRLLPFLDCRQDTLEDAIYLAAVNVEDALLTGGAKPGDDYVILDLYRMAIPVAVEMMRMEVVQSWREPSAQDA